jgi:serine/threonine protein kinase
MKKKRRKMKKIKSITLAQRVWIAAEIANGLAALHNVGLPHGHVHSDNVLQTLNDASSKVVLSGLPRVRVQALRDEAKHASHSHDLYWRAPELFVDDQSDGDAVDEFKADVYSFGVLLYELCMGDRPYRQMEERGEFVQRVCVDRYRPTLESSADIGDGFDDIVERCWRHEAAERPSMDGVVAELSRLLLDMVIDDDTGRRLWHTKFAPRVSVPWPRFADGFFAFFEQPLDPDSLNYRCLYALMSGLNSGDAAAAASLSPSPDAIFEVSVSKFADMLEWLGPMGDGGNVFDSIASLLRKDWFHGNLSGREAEAKIRAEAPGTYLLRFSASDPGSYAITALSRNRSAKHYRIYHKAGLGYLIGKLDCRTLDEVVYRFKKELFLRNPCARSPYARLFAIAPPPVAVLADRYTEFLPADALDESSSSSSGDDDDESDDLANDDGASTSD